MKIVWAVFIADDFVVNNLKTATLVFTLRDKKKKYNLVLTKSIGILKELIDKNFHPLSDDKCAAEM